MCVSVCVFVCMCVCVCVCVCVCKNTSISINKIVINTLYHYVPKWDAVDYHY